MPNIEVMSDKARNGQNRGVLAPISEDFWPPALNLPQLLFSVFCERAPLALPFASVPSPVTQSNWQSPRPPRLEARLRLTLTKLRALQDFDTIGLIGYGEFGKVFQVRMKTKPA